MMSRSRGVGLRTVLLAILAAFVYSIPTEASMTQQLSIVPAQIIQTMLSHPVAVVLGNDMESNAIQYNTSGITTTNSSPTATTSPASGDKTATTAIQATGRGTDYFKTAQVNDAAYWRSCTLNKTATLTSHALGTNVRLNRIQRVTMTAARPEPTATPVAKLYT